MPLGIDYVRIDLVDTITLNEPCARLIRGEPERAPNTRETGSGVYIYIYIFIYLFVRDLAWQRPNAHAQSPRVRR